jgi:hypothetical protein
VLPAGLRPLHRRAFTEAGLVTDHGDVGGPGTSDPRTHRRCWSRSRRRRGRTDRTRRACRRRAARSARPIRSRLSRPATRSPGTQA